MYGGARSKFSFSTEQFKPGLNISILIETFNPGLKSGNFQTSPSRSNLLILGPSGGCAKVSQIRHFRTILRKYPFSNAPFSGFLISVKLSLCFFLLRISTEELCDLKSQCGSHIATKAPLHHLFGIRVEIATGIAMVRIAAISSRLQIGLENR